MKLRFLLLSALLGGSLSVGWGFVTHGLGIPPSIMPKSFTDSTAVAQAVQANAPEHGVYFDGRGLFAAVSLHSDLRSHHPSMLYPVVHQLVIEVLVAFLLAWALLRLPLWTAWGTASIFATFGLAAGASVLLSQANWFGFALQFQLAELAAFVTGWFLLGLVLGALRKNLMVGGER
jgi:energy-converting hydrogenase Eha subunit A